MFPHTVSAFLGQVGGGGEGVALDVVQVAHGDRLAAVEVVEQVEQLLYVVAEGLVFGQAMVQAGDALHVVYVEVVFVLNGYPDAQRGAGLQLVADAGGQCGQHQQGEGGGQQVFHRSPPSFRRSCRWSRPG